MLVACQGQPCSAMGSVTATKVARSASSQASAAASSAGTGVLRESVALSGERDTDCGDGSVQVVIEQARQRRALLVLSVLGGGEAARIPAQQVVHPVAA